ncbi:hypothetical protein [Streptacidiphilus monticola]|uniref:Uncharacterized protein n=1 Tax=Streptacidiphilus monticola TaxID=2161674 RepID=A0ABW1G630_9ACTN
MKKFVKAAVAAALTAAALASVPGTAGAATPQFSMPFVSATPTALHAGQKVDGYYKIINKSGVTVTGTTWDLFIDQLGLTKSQPPMIWWRIDKGHWHLIHFGWAPPPVKGSEPQWQAFGMPFGTFKPHQTHTLELSWSFSQKAHLGIYPAWADLRDHTGGTIYCQNRVTADFYHR